MKKTIAMLCAALMLATPVLANRTCVQKKHPIHRPPAVRWTKCKPDTVVVEKSSKTPLIMGVAALVAGSIIAMSSRNNEHRVYVTFPPQKKGRCK